MDIKNQSPPFLSNETPLGVILGDGNVVVTAPTFDKELPKSI